MQDRAEVAAFLSCMHIVNGGQQVLWLCCYDGKPTLSSRLALALVVALAHLGLQMQSICQQKPSLPVVTMPMILLIISLSNVSFVD